MIGRNFIPATIATLPRRQALAFLSLFFFPGVVQAMLLTVVPLEALHLMGSARGVTVLYVGAGLLGIVGRFCIPYLVVLLRRRLVYTLGTITLMASSVLFSLNSVPAFAAGLVLSFFANACLDVTSQLYLLEHVSRKALKHFEPVRIFASAGPWTLGPWFGVYLQRQVGFAAPFAIAIASALVLLGLFWFLRFAEIITPGAAARPPPNPLRYLPRFFGQPRLRLAWTMAAARSSWWSMFYVYAPIFAVTSGLGAETGGVIVSVGTGWIWMVPLWGWVGRRFGLRRLLQGGHLVAGILSITVALAFGMPWLGAALLMAAAFGTEVIDGAGNLLFLRAVHAYERAEMTTVFVSFRDVAQLGPPLVCAVLLSLFSLPSVFVAGGVMMLGAAALAGRIPRRF